MRSVGIDVGRYSIKVVEIAANHRSYEVTRSQEYPTFNPQSTDQEIEILQALAQIAKDFDTETARTVTSVRQQYVSTRKLFFPFRERVKIQKSLPFELEDEMPLATEKAVYDSKVLAYKENATEVLAMACVTDEVEAMLNLFQASHIDPDIISPELCAIANLYENWQTKVDEFKALPGYEGSRLLVHMGHTKTFIGLILQGRIVWGRSILWGSENIAQAISQNFQVPYATALEMMPEKAFILQETDGAQADQIKMSETVANSLEPLVQATRLAIMTAKTQFTVDCELVELIGAPASIKNLSHSLSQTLEVEVLQGEPYQNLSYLQIHSFLELKDNAQVALGLAIEGLKKPFNPACNLRQMQFAKQNQSFAKFWDKWGYGIKIASAAYVLFFIYAVTLDIVGTHLEEASNDVLIEQAGKIANLKGGSATSSKIRSYIRENNNKAKLVKVFEEIDQLNSPVKLMSDISQALPSNKKDLSFEVRRFFVNNDSVDIQGVANNPQTVERIQKALRSLALGGKVEATSPLITPEAAKTSFAFNFKIKRKN